ncbi:MAG TPA: hypothetical protein VF170_12805 [Planctomycetaceae bacterium]
MVVLLATAYPLSAGPAAYAVGRGWLALPLKVYVSLDVALKSWPEAERLYYSYWIWCIELGREHSGRTPPMDNW